MERATRLVKTALIPSHELDKRKWEVLEAGEQVEKAKVLFDLYRDAADGV